MKIYNFDRKQKLKCFYEHVDNKIRALRQQHIEKQDIRLLSKIKPFRRVVNSDYFNGSYFVQGVEFKNEVNQLKTYWGVEYERRWNNKQIGFNYAWN